METSPDSVWPETKTCSHGFFLCLLGPEESIGFPKAPAGGGQCRAGGQGQDTRGGRGRTPRRGWSASPSPAGLGKLGGLDRRRVGEPCAAVRRVAVSGVDFAVWWPRAWSAAGGGRPGPMASLDGISHPHLLPACSLQGGSSKGVSSSCSCPHPSFLPACRCGPQGLVHRARPPVLTTLTSPDVPKEGQHPDWLSLPHGHRFVCLQGILL